MKVKDLPKVIKKRAKVYIKQNYPDGHKPTLLMGAFDWSETTEGTSYWIMVDDGRFLDAENHLRELRGEDMSEDLYEVEKEKKRKRIIELIEDAHWDTAPNNDKEFKGFPFFLDEALEVKVNEPEVVPYKDEMTIMDGYTLKKIYPGWKTISTNSSGKDESLKTDPIVESVREKLRQRSSVGIKKYGTTLADNNTDDFLLHLQEELLDAVLYIEKLISK